MDERQRDEKYKNLNREPCRENVGGILIGGPDFPGGSVVSNPPASTGGAGLIPELGRSPGEGNGYPLQ